MLKKKCVRTKLNFFFQKKRTKKKKEGKKEITSAIASYTDIFNAWTFHLGFQIFVAGDLDIHNYLFANGDGQGG